MRAALLIVLLAACSPDIAAGSYLCGPEELCPEGQACDGVDNICVLPSAARPFGCEDVTEVEPNNALANAQVIGNLACVSVPAEVLGCSPSDDGEDWYQFTIPSNCTAVQVESRISFPIAYAGLVLELKAQDGSTVGTGTPCTQQDPDDGDTQLCLVAPVTVGGRYAIRVTRGTEGDCGGACSYNRYALTIQLSTP